MQYQKEREDLTVLFRVAAKLNWHEAVANHFSMKVSENEMLINPRKLFNLMKPEDLALVNFNDPYQDIPKELDRTAIGLHAPIHQKVKGARCVLHLHAPYSLALACLEDSTLYPLDQGAASLYGKIVIDKNYGGLAMDEEGARCSEALSDPSKKILLLGNHGILTIGDSLGEAWNYLYYYERAAQNLITAYQTQKPLQILSGQVAQRVARENDETPDFYHLYFESLKEWIRPEL